MAEAFEWGPQSLMAYTLDNHNSVIGMRESALRAGASAAAVRLCDPDDGKAHGQTNFIRLRTAWHGMASGQLFEHQKQCISV